MSHTRLESAQAYTSLSLLTVIAYAEHGCHSADLRWSKAWYWLIEQV